jgi:mannosyltransferase OCH1-like enzyme
MRQKAHACFVSEAQISRLLVNKHLRKVLTYGRYLIDSPPRVLMDFLSEDTKGKSQIPNRVYQTWEDKKFGRTHWKQLIIFRKMNPDYSFFLLDREERDNYMKVGWGQTRLYQIYKNAIFGPMKADIFRYCIIYDFGGFYFDISKGISRPINEFLSAKDTSFLTLEGNAAPGNLIARFPGMPSQLLAQWGFGFTPKHPILEILLDQITNRFNLFENPAFKNPKAAILELTGPLAFYEAVGTYLSQGNQLRIIEQDFCGKGIYAMKGASYRFRKYPSYIDSQDSRLLL